LLMTSFACHHSLMPETRNFLELFLSSSALEDIGPRCIGRLGPIYGRPQCRVLMVAARSLQGTSAPMHV
jgi:hypothetical protein